MTAIDFIKRNITEDRIVSLLSKHGSKNIRRLGNTYRGTCPIHGGDNDTAFSFNTDNHLWCCFTECGGGDIFNLIALLYDIDIEKNFLTVVYKTAEELGLDITNMEIGKHEISYKEEMNSWLKYVLKRNQIFNIPYDIRKLGSRYKINDYRGISASTLEKYGVGYLKEMNRYIFPIYNENNETIGASLRAIGEEKPKWLHRPKSIQTGSILYNLKNCIDKGYRTIYIVEGIIDCIVLCDLGIDNVVCTFGARLTKEQKLILIKYFDEVILAFDNDKAGLLAIEKAIESLRKIMNVKILNLGEYKDPGMIKSIEEFSKLEVVSWIEWNKSKETK